MDKSRLGFAACLEPHHALCRTALLALMVLHAPSASALAQTEDLEPRTIGEPGITMVGFAGFVDRFYSSEEVLPVNYTAQIDLTRFITRRVALRGGLVGSGSFRGDTSDELPTGSGASALHALVGAVYYLTPQSMISLYGGAEYWAQLTRRTAPDVGSVLAKLGIQAAASSRVSLFIEGGYGLRLTRDDDDQLMSRLGGQIGIRFKF